MVEINIEREGTYQTKYLSFNFNRVRVGGVLSEILVTVNDVSDKIKLQAELEELKEKAQDQLNMLTNLLHIEPNEPILALKITGPGQRATLSALVQKGMKAVTTATFTSA